MNAVKSFVKKEIVLIIALALGIGGLIIMRPNPSEVVGFIDFRVLAILLSLMYVMEGFKDTGLFAGLAKRLSAAAKTRRGLILVLVFLCFFFSMLMTNDVALITFVPFAIMALVVGKQEKYIMVTVVLMTIAANLGSMLTPLGNPQNLYLYNLMGIGAGEFILLMLPYTAIAAGLLILCIFLLKNDVQNIATAVFDSDAASITLGAGRGMSLGVKNLLYAAGFVICLLCVLHIIPYIVMLIAVVALVLVTNFRLIVRADFSLLITFVGFFLFVGCISMNEQISQVLLGLTNGREIAIGVILSQVISNVPAALLLSGFSSNLPALTIGVNIGGLGTLIASMASLISYKQIAKYDSTLTGAYVKKFTLFNLLFLAVLVVFAVLLNLV